MPGRPTSAIETVGGKRRFQFTIRQLVLFVLSIAAVGAFITMDCISFVLPVMLGWLWWFARKRGLWGWTALTFAIPAVLLFTGHYCARRSGVPFNAERSFAQDWTLLAHEWQSALADWVSPTPKDVICVFSEPHTLTFLVWGLALPFVFVGLSQLAVIWTGGSHGAGFRYALLGALPGLLLAGCIQVYPHIRAEYRRGILERATTPIRISVASPERSVCLQIDPQLTGETPIVERDLLAPYTDEYGHVIQKPRPGSFTVRIPESMQGELVALLDQHRCFYMDEEMYFGGITHNLRCIRLQCGTFRMWVWTQSYVTTLGLPVAVFEREVPLWLYNKGACKPWQELGRSMPVVAEGYR